VPSVQEEYVRHAVVQLVRKPTTNVPLAIWPGGKKGTSILTIHPPRP